MTTYQTEDFTITLNKQGSHKYVKVSYPIRFGVYNEIETSYYIYQFNLNGEIRIIQAKDKDWPRDEWIKRTVGNDWIYYTPGIYTGLLSYIGEYYLPCFSYNSNSIFAYRPFENTVVDSAISSIDGLINILDKKSDHKIPKPIKEFLRLISKNNTEALASKNKQLHKILDGQVTVLPPDSRHTDYDLIPVMISDGCLYNCGFCMVKDGRTFQVRSQENIIAQIQELKNFYGRTILNYNSLFLGQNDALNAGEEVIEFTISYAFESFNFSNSYMFGNNLFIFGSVGSFLNSKDSLFKILNSSPYYTYINIGLESADRDTLHILNKPITLSDIHDSIFRMMEINRRYDKIEVTANFILSDNLPESHIHSLIDLNKILGDSVSGKGCLYLSPLNTKNSDILLKKIFIQIKNKMNMPVYLYLIQRL